MGIILLLAALLFMICAAVLTAADSAFYALSRHEAVTLRNQSKSRALAKILDATSQHSHAIRFWRIWFETAAAVAVALAYSRWLDSPWLTGLLATITMAGLGFVLVSVSPRRYGRSNAGKVVQQTAGLVRFLRLVLGPLTGWLVSIGHALSPEGSDDEEGYLGKERLRDIVDRASEGADLDEESAERISSVIDLEDTHVRAVMVPRTDMVTLESGTAPKDALELFINSGYSRIPLIGEDADDVKGVIYLKDLIRSVHAEEKEKDIDALARTTRFVPDSKNAAELLQELQQESIHLAVVIDEYGGTAGLITLEDLIEEIVGEIDDEYDRARAEVEEQEDGSYIVRANTAIDELEDLFDMYIEEEDVDTVAGLLSKALESVPILGSTAIIHGLSLRVVTLSGRRNRIGKVHVSRVAIQPTTEKERTEENS